MKKLELTERITANMSETKAALQTLWGNINQGQKKQLVKRGEIKALLDRYGVEYERTNDL